MVCRLCGAAKSESEFYQVSNKSRCRTKDWTYYRTECKKCSNAGSRARHVKNRERDRIHMAKYYQANNGWGGLYDFSRARSCAKKRGATQFCTRKEWVELRKGAACTWCGGGLHPSFTHVDHVVPLCEGGQHTRDNLVLSCANCNQQREWERKVKDNAQVETR